VPPFLIRQRIIVPLMRTAEERLPRVTKAWVLQGVMHSAQRLPHIPTLIVLNVPRLQIDLLAHIAGGHKHRECCDDRADVCRDNQPFRDVL